MSVGLGGADSSALRFSRTRGRTGASSDYGLQYPSPFFDIGQTYLPATIKQMFRWCRYYFLVNPLINAVVAKMADYPVTDIILDTDKPDLKEKWYHFLDSQLRYRPFQIELGLDFYAYGNALVSIFYPFIKMLRCKRCGHEKPAADATYRFQNFEFHWECSKCSHADIATVRDHYVKAPKGIRLLRWNPEDIDIRYNDITGDTEYYYTIPVQIKNDIIMGKKSTVETMPQLFIDALRLRKAVVFSRDNIYHFKRPTLAGKDRGWGTPLILPVLKDTYYLQVLRKAQECLTLSSLLERPFDLCKASEIRIGDLVKTHTGAYKRVTDIRPKLINEQNGGFTVQVATKAMKAFPTGYSDNHPLYVLRREELATGCRANKHINTKYVRRYTDEYAPKWVNAGDVKLGEYVVYPIDRLKNTSGEVLDISQYTGLPATTDWVYQQSSKETVDAYEALEQGDELPWADNAQHAAHTLHNRGKTPPRVKRYISLDEDLAYLSGWFIGDGSTGDRQISIALGLKDDYKLLAKAFKKVFGKEPKISKSKRFNGRLLVHSDVIATKFMRGWIPGDAHTKSLPKEIQQAPDQILLSFLRGYVEADGCFHNDLDRVTFTSVSPQLAYQVWKLLISLRCVARVSKRKESQSIIEDKLGRRNKAISGVSYDIVLDGSSGRRLRALLYGGEVEDAAGGHTGFFHGDYFASPICNWERLTEQHVLSFEVEDDHTFCTPGMVTHNSIALEHIVPLRVLFPQAGSASSDPYCVALDSLVETREGIFPAGEVKKGDWLKTHTGAWKPVEAAVDRKIRTGEKVYEFSIASLSAFPFKVSEEHPILAVKRPSRFRGYESLTEEPDYIEAKNIDEGDFVCYPKHRTVWDSLDLDLHEYCPERAFTAEYMYRRLDQQSADIYEYFEANGVPSFAHGERKTFLADKGWTEDYYNNAKAVFSQQEAVDRIPRYLPVTKDLAYVVGMYAAEGSQKDLGISFSLNAAEDSIMGALDSALQGMGFASGHRYIRDNSAQYDVGDVFLGSLLPQLCGKGAQNKRLPRFIVEAPEEIALRAVEAVFLGDGCSINSKTRREGLKTVSPQLTIDVRAILLSFGLIANVQKSIPGEHEIAKLPYYQVNLNGSQGDAFANLCSSGTRTHKGFSRCGFVRGDYVYLRVSKKSESPDVKVVRGFQIKGDKSFCIVGVATHNTSVNLQDWHDQIAGELRRWRSDNSYIPILPLPIGQQTIGGDGRALLLSQEIRVWSEHIIAGMGVPTELIFGGLSYCQAPDTLLFTSHGLETLEELTPAEEGQGTSNRKVVSHMGVRDVVRTHHVGLKKAASAKTRLGLELTGAYTHPVYVLQPDLTMAFKTMEELKPGDRVAVKAGANLWPKDTPKIDFHTTKSGDRFEDVTIPQELTPELARLLGYLIAEGSCTEARRIGFGNSDQEVNTDFADCVEAVFGYRPKFHLNLSMPVTTKPFYQTEISRQQATEFLYALGIGGYAAEKTVPRIIRLAPKHLVAEFLRAYFEGDGGSEDVEDKQAVTACSMSGRLLQEIQLLMLNMGIVTSRYFPRVKSTFTLQARSEYVDIFAKEIGFISSCKKRILSQRTPTRGSSCLSSQIPYLKERLEEFRDRHFENRSSWKFESVNVELLQEQYTVDEIAVLTNRERSTILLHINSGALTAVKQPSVQGRFAAYTVSRQNLEYFLKHHGLGRRRTTPKSFWGMSYEKLATKDLSFIKEKEPDFARRIENLAEMRLIWDEVQEVNLLDIEIPMRDLTVDEASTYQGNGVISHNSGSNVSLRMLENMFLGYLSDQLALLRWIIEKTASYLGWAKVGARFKPFKMADDLQRKAYLFQLNQAGKISDESLCSDADYDSSKEDAIMENEATRRIGAMKKQRLLQAEMEGEAAMVQQKWQTKAQNKAMSEQMAIQGEAAKDQMAFQSQMQNGMMQDQMAVQTGQEAPPKTPDMMPAPRDPSLLSVPKGITSPLTLQSVQQHPVSASNADIAGGQNVDLLFMARKLADKFSRLNPGEKPVMLSRLKELNPILYSTVTGLMMSGGNGPTAAAQASARPLPLQRTPRRGSEAAQI